MIATAWITWCLLWVGLLAGLVFSGLYSGMETGVYVFNKIRLDLLAESGRRSGRLLRRMLAAPTNLLAVLLVGNNLANYLTTFIVSTMFMLTGAERFVELGTLAVVTPILFVLGESVPKNVFHRRHLGSETLTLRMAWFLKVSSWVYNATGLAPLVRGFSAVLLRALRAAPAGRSPLAHEGVSAVVAEGAASGVLTQFQSLMADRIINIRQVTLWDAMKPMHLVATIPGDAGRDAILKIVTDHNYTRFPVVGPGGNVTGILDIYDVLTADGDAPLVARASGPLVLQASMTISDALYSMQRRHTAMAVVAQQQKHVGIVTIKDLVEEIVGELEAW